jgi:hypothetical protein
MLEKPIDILAKEVMDVVNKVVNADRNNDGKIKGGEITTLIFATLSEVPQVAKAINETVAYYKEKKDLPVQTIIADIFSAIGQAMHKLDIKNKDWIPALIDTLRVVIVGINAGTSWANYNSSRK